MKLRHVAKTLGAYALILLVMVLVGLLLLEGAAFLPQARVLTNYKESCAQFEAEGYSPFILNRWRADGRLNNRSEFLILQYSVYLNVHATPDAALTNAARVSFEVTPEAITDMRDAALAGEAPNDFYVRYWMGFRAAVRGLLTFCNYGDMRRLLMLAYGTLAALCAVTLARKTNGWRAPMAFALSLLLFNPVVVSTSFQFGCCYLLAMAGMLLVSALHGKVSPCKLLFGIAIATQYFDFYTTPSLTLAYPLLMWLVCECYAPHSKASVPLWRMALRCAAAWLAGYALMWGSKLLLTTLFTDINAFASGFGSMKTWIGASGRALAGPLQAFRDAFAVLGGLSVAVAAGYALLSALAGLRKRPDRQAVGRMLLCAGVGLVSIVWIAVAARPTAMHAYFQYRTLGGLVFAVTLAPAFLTAPRPGSN